MVEDVPNWLALAQAASLPMLAIAGIVAAVTQLIKIWPMVQKNKMDGDHSLRTDLLERVQDLEGEVRALRIALDTERLSHATEILDMQHDLANESASLDALILLIEANPDRVLEQLPKIRNMREKHRERMALKRGAREAALINKPPEPVAA